MNDWDDLTMDTPSPGEENAGFEENGEISEDFPAEDSSSYFDQDDETAIDLDSDIADLEKALDDIPAAAEGDSDSVEEETAAIEEEPGVADEETAAAEAEPVFADEETAAAEAEPVFAEEDPVPVETEADYTEEEPEVYKEEPGFAEEDPAPVETEADYTEEEPEVYKEEPGFAEEKAAPAETETGFTEEEPGVFEEKPVFAEEEAPSEEPDIASHAFIMRDPEDETRGSGFTMRDTDEELSKPKESNVKSPYLDEEGKPVGGEKEDTSGEQEDNTNAGSSEETSSSQINTKGIHKKGWGQRIQRRLPLDPETEAARRKQVTIALSLAAVLAIAVTAMVFFYNSARKAPAHATEKYLASIQAMDFDTLKLLLQDGDLSALDSVDVTSPIYEDFFRLMNGQMTYNIRSTSLNLAEGTARVTAHIRYVDGTDLYKAVVTEFLRDIVSSAFSGESLEDVNTQEKLAALLDQKEVEMGVQFAETEITYPLVKTDNEWKIASLDEQTVKVMSANFGNIEREINRSLDESAAEASGERAIPTDNARTDTGSDLVNFQSLSGLTLETDTFAMHYDSFKVAEDYAGKNCLLYYYVFTNLGDSPTSAMVNINLSAYQNGVTLAAAIPNQTNQAIDNYFTEVAPGESIQVCQAFSLSDYGNVSVQVRPSFSFDTEGAATQTLRLE